MPTRLGPLIKTAIQFRREALQRAGITPAGGHQFTLMDSCSLSGATLDPDLCRRGGGYLGQNGFAPGAAGMALMPVHPLPEGAPRGETLVPLEKNFTEEEREAAREWEARSANGLLE